MTEKQLALLLEVARVAVSTLHANDQHASAVTLAILAAEVGSEALRAAADATR